MSSQEQSWVAVEDVDQPVIQRQVAVEDITEGGETSHKPLLVGLAVFALSLGAVIFFEFRREAKRNHSLKPRPIKRPFRSSK